ncbi:MAG: HIT family protein [Thaumarchaeota archaeon]|nr:HIT family protein [Nitrososphaerota archaeon]MCL5318326.1 HIT family protein [Nitrososphaerota archaeon]
MPVADTGQCIFCRITKHEASAARVYEDDEVLVFMDKAPFNTGHTLVIPKKHYAFLTEMSDEEVAKLFAVTNRVVKAVFRAVKADGVNVAQSNGRAASQDIFHVHVHIVPRFEGDAKKGFGFFPPRKNMSGQELEEIAGKISRALDDLA